MAGGAERGNCLIGTQNAMIIEIYDKRFVLFDVKKPRRVGKSTVLHDLGSPIDPSKSRYAPYRSLNDPTIVAPRDVKSAPDWTDKIESALCLWD
jgi:hypothetical protein